MSRADQLLLLKARDLSSEEVAVVGTALDNDDVQDEYRAILALGRANAVQYRSAVERRLRSERDPMVARIALQVLCDHWGLTGDYLHELIRFARGVVWDDDRDVEQVSLSILGEWARESAHDSSALATLLSIVEDRSRSYDTHEDTLRALARAVGWDWSEIPPVSAPIVLSDQWAKQVVTSANAMYASSLE